MNNTAIRNVYMWRLAGRIVVLICCVALCILKPAQIKVMEGMEFFKQVTLLHVFWVIWMIDLTFQLIPAKVKTSIGSQKIFQKWYRSDGDWHHTELVEHSRTANKRAFIIFLMWAAFIAAIGVIYHKGLIGNAAILIFSTAFYVCDLICVLFWCPFRLILGNKCCTTCRIFNWDHFMMFTPFLFIPGFFTWSLLGISAVVMLFWELTALIHPERFWHNSNDVLKCVNCTDKLCTQHCNKQFNQRRKLWE